MNPIAWLVEGPSGAKTPMTDEVAANGYRDMDGFTVTPLCAAPPAQTVEEVREMLTAYTNAFCGVEYAPSEDERVRLLVEADAVEARLLSIVSCAAPPAGAPSWEELRIALRGAEEELRKAAAYYARQGWWDNETDARSARAAASALLSRLPQQERTDQ